ncbi:hypothetical protein [Beijerinckia mobilis]|uniref:hypothetical protein n=1 Tax=Beijerinckia mobilis TaxID=231434 RepID=UPI00068D1997|nr:hypothetical protein [Beijerinckia mobilis]
MTITSEFLVALAHAAEISPGERTIPWPSPGAPGGFVTFANFAEWQKIICGFRLASGVPHDMVDLFDRALKLYLAAWLDFDLVVAGEMAAFAALEHSLRDRYLNSFRQRHMEKVIARAKREKREPMLNENFRHDSVKLSDLLQHMHQHDKLTDDLLPCIRKYGGSVMRRLTDKGSPALAELRNDRAHGNPFGSEYQSGLLELIRDLIEYAYRDRIR